MKYPKRVKHNGLRYNAEIQRRKSRRGQHFWIIMYLSKTNSDEGYIHLPLDWQDIDRTYTFQDIYWEDKYDCRIAQLAAA